MRLQRFLAHAGIASRRRSEELILAGRVKVNGRVVRVLGSSVTDDDRVEFDGRVLAVATERSYLVVHKPVSMMTTMSDPEGRRTIATLFPPSPRIVPVGRLDYDTSGVVLATNDGDLAHVLTHPRYGVEKTYRALVRGRLQPDDVRAILDGVRLEEGRAEPARIRVVRTLRLGSEIDVTIHEGRNRQVRRMFEAIDHPVVALTRLRFGPISLGDLPIGASRPVTERELAALHLIATAAADADGSLGDEA